MKNLNYVYKSFLELSSIEDRIKKLIKKYKKLERIKKWNLFTWG